ncbi:hypothetical protein GCM10022210_48640 [Mucilaginibacter dorajii]|uniref:DUF4410 domain-containing protein n=2 Tax=Mucilaginibacter dorajii TaxID=692994 RepID=A0ABP7QYH0_9SPHI
MKIKVKLTILTLFSFVSTIAAAQQVKKKLSVPITDDGYHTVPNTSQSKIFNDLLKAEQKLVDEKKSIILLADSTKGILNIKRIAHCSYLADTAFNGKTLKNAATKDVSYEYIANFKVGDNIFTYKIIGFSTTSGQAIMKNDLKNAKLSSCAQSEIWSFKDRLTAQAVLMGMRKF